MERNTFIPIAGESAETITYLKGILEDARATTLERIEGITKDELNWHYADGWNSIGNLLHHFIANDHYFRIIFVKGSRLTDAELTKWEPGQVMGEHLPTLEGTPLEQLLADMQSSRAELKGSIETVTPAYFAAHRQGYNPETGFNLAWALYHLAEDEVHHRGQISILRKLYAARS